MADTKLRTFDPVICTLSNTPYPLSASQVPVTSLTIMADGTNIGSVYIGDDAVSVANGMEVPPKDICEATPELLNTYVKEFFANEVYVVSATAGNSVRVAGWVRR